MKANENKTKRSFKMKRTILILSVLTLLLSNSPVQADRNQETKRTWAKKVHRTKENVPAVNKMSEKDFQAINEERLNTLFEKLDLDKDGKLSKEELANLGKVRMEMGKEMRERFRKQSQLSQEKSEKKVGKDKRNFEKSTKSAKLVRSEKRFRGDKSSREDKKVRSNKSPRSHKSFSDVKQGPRSQKTYDKARGHKENTSKRSTYARKAKFSAKKGGEQESLEAIAQKREKFKLERFAELDKNSDGVIDRAEWLEFRGYGSTK